MISQGWLTFGGDGSLYSDSRLGVNPQILYQRQPRLAQKSAFCSCKLRTFTGCLSQHTIPPVVSQA
jgi:hypothetical protein